MQQQQQQQQSRSGSKQLEPPVRFRPVFAAPTVFKLELPATSSPQSAAEWSTVVDASFRELCRHIAREHDPHRAVLEIISPSAAAASSSVAGAQSKALMSPSSHARSMSSPVAKPTKRNPSASPTGRSSQASAAAPASAAAASPVAAAAAKSPYEHLLLFPRRSATALAALATPAPKVESQAEKQARLSHAAQIKAAKLARRQNRKSMQAALQLEEHPPPVPIKAPSKEVLEKADKLFQAYQRSITHPEEVAAAATAAASSASASPPVDSALIPVPTSARKHAATPRKMIAPAPSPRRPQLEGRLIAQRVDQFETPLAAATAAASAAATHQPKSKSVGGATLLRIEAPPRSHSRAGSPRSRSLTPRPKSPHTPRPHSPPHTPSARAAEARVAARADARARAASITLSSPPLSARRPSKSQHPAEAEEKQEPEPEAPAVDSDEDLLEAITVSAQGTARGRPKSPVAAARLPVESPRSQARGNNNDTTDNFADDDEDAVAAAAGDLNLSLDDDHDASLWDSPAAVVASVAANKFTPREEPVAASARKSSGATPRKEQIADKDFPATQQSATQRPAPATPSPATPSPATPAAAAAPAAAPSSARGAPSASLPASAIAAAASSPISPSGGVRLRNLQVSPIIGAKPADSPQRAAFASEAALDGDTSFAQVQDDEQQYAPEHEQEHEADEALEADLFGSGDDHPEDEEQFVSSAADDDYIDGAPDSGRDDEEDHEANERFLRGEISARTSRKDDAQPSKSGTTGQVEAFEPEQEDQDAAAEEEERKDSFPAVPASSASAVPATAAGGKKLTPMQEAAHKRAQEVAAKQAYDATIARQNAAVLAASSKAAAESAAIASAQSASQKLVEDSLALHRALTEQVQRGAFMTKLTPGVFSTKAQKKFVRVSSHGDRSASGDV